VLQGLLERLVQLARERRVIQGRRLRVDTTVVETHIHYPTDSALLVDGVRMLTRMMARLRARVDTNAIRFRNRTRSLARRAFAISQRSRAATLRSAASVREQNKARMTALYREAIRITRAVVRDAEAVAVTVSATSPRPVTCLRDRLSQTVGLIRRVLQQTRARVLKGDVHYPDKVLHRWVGLGVIANDLLALGRASPRGCRRARAR
jgi:IS5 family transposase